jgi:hypothetical protein
MRKRAPILRRGAMAAAAALLLALSACVVPPGEGPAPGSVTPSGPEPHRR